MYRAYVEEASLVVGGGVGFGVGRIAVGRGGAEGGIEGFGEVFFFEAGGI